MSNIDILRVGKKESVPSTEGKNFCSLDEYLIIARKTISAYAPGIRSGLAEEMLNNEDSVSNVAHAIMMADWAFDGRGSIHGFRKQRALWAIKSYVGRSVKNNQRKMLSLDKPIGSFSEGGTSFVNNLADNSASPEDIVGEQEEVEKLSSSLEGLLESGIISDQAATYIRLHYLEDVPMAEIAKKYNVTRQGVHNLIKRSLLTLREYAGDDDFFRGIITND